MNLIIIAFILSFELPPELELEALVPLALVPLVAMELARPLANELVPSVPGNEMLLGLLTPVSACCDVPNVGVVDDTSEGLPLGIVRDMLELSHAESLVLLGGPRLSDRPLKS